VNLMPLSLLRRIGKSETDLKPHNIMLSNYEGKSGRSIGAIEVNLTVGTTMRPTLFIVVPSKANYNLLLGREWIHGVGAVPSTMHQRLVIWKENGLVENIEADQSYFLAEVNHVSKKTFDKNLANIAPCAPAESEYIDVKRDFCSIKLDPTHGLRWEKDLPIGVMVPPSGWEENDDFYD